MEMKKFAYGTLSGTLALSLALVGCGGSPQAATTQAPTTAATTQTPATPATPTTPETQTPTTPTTPPDQLMGGWQVFNGTTPAYTDDEKAVFDQAIAGLVGMNYELVRVLGTQLVSGTNYAFLARGPTVTANPSSAWYVLIVYQDLSGNVSLTAVNPIDLTNPKTTDKSVPAGFAGAWELYPPANSALEPPEAADAFNKAGGSYEGVTLSPIATLATQVVAGTNYKLLCQGAPADGGSKPQLYLVTVYADLQGGAQVSDAQALDVLGQA